MKKVHLSIDDVCNAFRWLANNRPESLFDMRLFGKLYEWHEKYGISFSLYCFAETEGFKLLDIPQCYAKDFANSREWLKFGYHGRCAMRFEDDKEYDIGFEMFKQVSDNLMMKRTDILRLHNWYATSEQKKYLHKMGIKTLLYPDVVELPYEDNDMFIDCSLEHWKTHIRFEYLQELSESSLKVGKERIVAFTHEKYFDGEADKIEKAIKIYMENGYDFERF